MYNDDGIWYGHGGDIYSQNVKLDFSVNTNPFLKKLPPEIEYAGEKALKLVGCYPDPRQIKLRDAIGKLENTDPDNIVCTNGASELLLSAVRAIKPSQALLAVPCFSGYQAALFTADCKIKYYMLSAENDFMPYEKILQYITADIDILILANPNNPTGRLIDEELLEEISKKCKDANCLLVTDACFHPLSHGTKLYGDIVVKAFTKVMSMPGVRLGYGIIRDQKLSKALQRQLPEWNISVFAQEMGIAAAEYMSDQNFLWESVRLIDKERQFLTEQLVQLGIKVFKSDTSFLLFFCDTKLYTPLLKKGILIRDASNFTGLKKGYYRIAVKAHDDNVELIKEIKSIL